MKKKCKCKHIFKNGKKCAHEWDSRVDKPLACPKCRQYTWDDDPKENTDE